MMHLEGTTVRSWSPDFTRGASDSKRARKVVPDMPRKHGIAGHLTLKMFVILRK